MKAEETRQVTTQTEELARNAGGAVAGAETDVTTRLRTNAELEQGNGLMDAVCERSNILLTELDRELERRGHAFCRNADDCNIYVKSQVAGERLMASLPRFLSDTLKLTVTVSGTQAPTHTKPST